MQINLQGKNIELTEAIKDYVSKRVTNLEKLLSNLEIKKGEAVLRDMGTKEQFNVNFDKLSEVIKEKLR